MLSFPIGLEQDNFQTDLFSIVPCFKRYFKDNKVVTNNFAIQTDYLLQDEVDYLGAISESPSVWAYIGDDPTPYTVTVNTISYNYKLVKQVKLVQAIYDLTYTKTQQKQNL